VIVISWLGDGEGLDDGDISIDGIGFGVGELMIFSLTECKAGVMATSFLINDVSNRIIPMDNKSKIRIRICFRVTQSPHFLCGRP